MITRDLAEIRAVRGVGQFAYDASCGSLNGDSTGNLIAGHIIDRLNLGRAYNSAALVATAGFDIGTSTLDAKFGAISAWLYHSSTTCADDFDRFSTDREQSRGKAYVYSGPNTTSTLASGFMATSTAVGTFGTFSATATGFAAADYNATYDLSGAGRYLRPYALPEVYASSSGGSVVRGAVTLIFGAPDVSPRDTSSTGPAYKA